MISQMNNICELGFKKRGWARLRFWRRWIDAQAMEIVLETTVKSVLPRPVTMA